MSSIDVLCPVTEFRLGCIAMRCPLYHEDMISVTAYNMSDAKKYLDRGYTLDFNDTNGNIQLSKKSWKCGYGRGRDM